MVYEIPEAEMRQLVSAKVESQFARSFKYVESLNAQVVAPSAGPPSFLDDELFAFNVISGDELSIFPDQSEFLRRLSQMNLGRGVMNIPGTVVTIQNGSVEVAQPCDESQLATIFENKGEYLQQYKADWAERIAHEKATWGVPGLDVLQTLKLWWEPLMSMAPTLCSLVGANCLIRSGTNEILIDFAAHQVRAHANEPYGFRFEIPSEILESVISVRAVDWSNSLFLSCRFKAWREGEFNEYLYNFFKSLNPDRMSRTESEARGKVTKQEDSDEIELGGYTMERYCPHRKADLSIFGECDGKVLTCTLHGWKFDLETGKCLTADDKALRVRRSNN
jgi:UDP-MurNAc hydroxylase